MKAIEKLLQLSNFVTITLFLLLLPIVATANPLFIYNQNTQRGVLIDIDGNLVELITDEGTSIEGPYSRSQLSQYLKDIEFRDLQQGQEIRTIGACGSLIPVQIGEIFEDSGTTQTPIGSSCELTTYYNKYSFTKKIQSQDSLGTFYNIETNGDHGANVYGENCGELTIYSHEYDNLSINISQKCLTGLWPNTMVEFPTLNSGNNLYSKYVYQNDESKTITYKFFDGQGIDNRRSYNDKETLYFDGIFEEIFLFNEYSSTYNSVNYNHAFHGIYENFISRKQVWYDIYNLRNGLVTSSDKVFLFEQSNLSIVSESYYHNYVNNDSIENLDYTFKNISNLYYYDNSNEDLSDNIDLSKVIKIDLKNALAILYPNWDFENGLTVHTYDEAYQFEPWYNPSALPNFWVAYGTVSVVDLDGDGHYPLGSSVQPADDCNDTDPSIFGGAEEICGDNIDNDCDGVVDENCCPEIISFTATDTSLNPETGEYTLFNFETDQPVDRASITINGEDVSSGWDARLKNKVVPPGRYTVTLEVELSGCIVTSSIIITVESYTSCRLRRPLGSSVNLAGGELTDQLSLFRITGNPGFDIHLYYGSQNYHEGSLGLSWSHTYDIFISENQFGDAILHKGDGNYSLYTTAGNGNYSSPAGNYSFLTKNSEDGWELTSRGGKKQHFNQKGQIVAIVDRNSNALIFTYDNDLLSSVSDLSGRAVTFNYDGNGKLTNIITPGGQIYAISVGEAVDSITPPSGGQWIYNYYEYAYLVDKTDPEGNTTIYDYDDQYRVVSAIDPAGKERRVIYPENRQTVSTTLFMEKDDSIWQYSYDIETGELVSKADPNGNTTLYSFDVDHNLTSRNEPGIGTSYYSYDSLGNMTSTTNVAEQTTEYTYNSFCQVTSVTNPADETTIYTYDDRGNLTMVTGSDDNSVNYDYDAQGRLTSITSATDMSTNLSYDDHGNIVSVTGPDSVTILFAYDDNSNRTSITDAKGNITRYEYDANNNLVKMIDAKDKTTNYHYDANDNRTSVTDANGKTTLFEYNFEGQMTSITDALGDTTRFVYGGSSGCSTCGGGIDKLTAIINAKEQSTMFKYNSLGKLTRETNPLGKQIDYMHDDAGRVESKTDPNGNTIHYSYDSLSRLVSKSYPDGRQTTFEYNLEGNLLSAENQHISYTFGYDESKRLSSVIDSHGNQTQYSYDASGNRIRMSTLNGIDVTYIYDNAERLEKIVSQAGEITFGFDDLSRRNAMVFPNGVHTSYEYDDLGRLTDLSTTYGSNIIAENHYTHDDVGNRLSNRDARHTVSYGYDDVYRLTLAQSNTPGNSPDKGKNKSAAKPMTNQQEFYKYDSVGNRTSSGEHEYYLHNVGNELLSADSVNYTYDDNGNQISKTTADGTTYYSWDYENRLSGLELPDGTSVTFTYDPFGRRIGKTSGGTTISYTYDNEDILFQTEDDSLGNIYVHGPGIDEPLILIGKKGTNFYHADGLGSIVAMTDDQARNVQQYEYDSFGNQHDMKNRIKQPYGYTGREHDRETGLRYYRARYYDGEVGRFISEDPIGFAGGDVNLYNYVLANSVNYVDPYGKTPIYGYWCGPDWTGGVSKPWNEITPDQQSKVTGPVNELDKCCETHDKCYAKCRDDNSCDEDKQSECFKTCDRNLSTCAGNCDTDGISDFLIETYMFYSNP
jgi:RHS repeat-associated protein